MLILQAQQHLCRLTCAALTVWLSHMSITIASLPLTHEQTMVSPYRVDADYQKAYSGKEVLSQGDVCIPMKLPCVRRPEGIRAQGWLDLW